MPWGGWFLIAYLGLGSWVATAALLSGMPVAEGRPLKAGALALIVMWALPPLLIGAFFLKGKSK